MQETTEQEKSAATRVITALFVERNANYSLLGAIHGSAIHSIAQKYYISGETFSYVSQKALWYSKNKLSYRCAKADLKLLKISADIFWYPETVAKE